MKSFYTSHSALLSHAELGFAFLCNQGIILPSRAIGIEFPNRKLDVNASQVVFTTGIPEFPRAINFKHGGGENHCGCQYYYYYFFHNNITLFSR